MSTRTTSLISQLSITSLSQALLTNQDRIRPATLSFNLHRQPLMVEGSAARLINKCNKLLTQAWWPIIIHTCTSCHQMAQVQFLHHSISTTRRAVRICRRRWCHITARLLHNRLKILSKIMDRIKWGLISRQEATFCLTSSKQLQWHHRLQEQYQPQSALKTLKTCKSYLMSFITSNRCSPINNKPCRASALNRMLLRTFP